MKDSTVMRNDHGSLYVVYILDGKRMGYRSAVMYLLSCGFSKLEAMTYMKSL